MEKAVHGGTSVGALLVYPSVVGVSKLVLDGDDYFPLGAPRMD